VLAATFLSCFQATSVLETGASWADNVIVFATVLD
jgi:hypothetical protein